MVLETGKKMADNSIYLSLFLTQAKVWGYFAANSNLVQFVLIERNRWIDQSGNINSVVVVVFCCCYWSKYPQSSIDKKNCIE